MVVVPNLLIFLTMASIWIFIAHQHHLRVVLTLCQPTNNRPTVLVATRVCVGTDRRHLATGRVLLSPFHYIRFEYCLAYLTFGRVSSDVHVCYCNARGIM